MLKKYVLGVAEYRPAAVRILRKSRYYGVFTLCRPGASSPKITNLFFLEPLDPVSYSDSQPLFATVHPGSGASFSCTVAARKVMTV